MLQSLLKNPKFKRYLTFAFGLMLLLFILGSFIWNIWTKGRGLSFAFLFDPAGYDISPKLWSFEQDNTHFSALLIGLGNSLWASLWAALGATILGLVLALGQVSSHWLTSCLSKLYVRIFRNIPLLVILGFIYFGLVLHYLPPLKESWHLGSWGLINNRGLFLPNFWLGTKPVIQGFKVEGAWQIYPEMLALIVGIIVYSSAFIAETLRSSFLSIPRSTQEAAAALGLKAWQQKTLIILPLMWKTARPMMLGQYINILKNSSLGIVIGYPELLSILGGTSLHKTGREIEIILILMLVYAIIAIGLSRLSAYYEKKSALWS